MVAELPADLKLDGKYCMKEVTQILEIDKATLWRWIQKGKISVSGHFAVNGRPYIKGKEIRRSFNREN